MVIYTFLVGWWIQVLETDPLENALCPLHKTRSERVSVGVMERAFLTLSAS
jgi:hypothetical protein